MSARRRSAANSNPSAKMFKVVIGLIAAVLASFFAIKNQPEREAVVDKNFHKVVYVSDGDTFKLDNGERVRLIGIDTPESRENEKMFRDVKRTKKDAKTLIAMGKKASAYMKSLLSDQYVRLEFDVEPRDRYGRQLAYVYLKDGTFINEKVIRDGYAYPLTIPPNVRHAEDFQRWFKEAQEQRRGLWQ